jgi:transposase
VDTSPLEQEGYTMADKSVRYTPEFKRQMVGLWAKQAARDAGSGDGGLTSAEREELARLRRENRRLKGEREILSKAAAWFATESAPSKRSSGS